MIHFDEVEGLDDGWDPKFCFFFPSLSNTLPPPPHPLFISGRFCTSILWLILYRLRSLFSGKSLATCIRQAQKGVALLHHPHGRSWKNFFEMGTRYWWFVAIRIWSHCISIPTENEVRAEGRQIVLGMLYFWNNIWDLSCFVQILMNRTTAARHFELLESSQV